MTNVDYSPKPSVRLNFKVKPNFLAKKKNSTTARETNVQTNDTTYLLGSNLASNGFFNNDSMNLSNQLNNTNEYNSLSPSNHNNPSSNLNTSLQIKSNNEL